MSDDRFVGIRFVDRGRVLAGIDCWGLVRLFLAEEMGVKGLPEYAGTPASELMAVAREIDRAKDLPMWLPVDRRFAQRGDVVTMLGTARVNGRPTQLQTHVGVMVDPRRVLHVEEAAASAIVKLDHPSIRHRVAGLYRHRDLA